jgi:hypothetical protein
MTSRRAGFITVLFTIAMASVPSPLHADQCRPFNGYFVSTFDVGPGCPDSSTIPPQCTHGRLYSDSDQANQVATYEFSFTSQGYGGTPYDPVRLVFAGDSVITETDGTVISGHDDGDLYLNPSERGQLSFQTRVHPYLECPPAAACHALAPSSSIVADGDLDLVTNTAAGTYTGQICTP